MADWLKEELNKINEERSRTSDPNKLHDLNVREEQWREDYREAINCGLLADCMSDFDAEGWD